MTNSRSAAVISDTAHARALAVAEFLRVEAYRQRISQAALAERLGVAKTTVSAYLSGKWPIPVPTFITMCEILGLNAGEVLDNAAV